MTTSVCNTTALQVKPDFRAPYHTTVIPSVPGISEFYLAQYIRTDGKQEIKFFNSPGQNVPSDSVPVPSCHACLLTEYPYGFRRHKLYWSHCATEQ